MYTPIIYGREIMLKVSETTLNVDFEKVNLNETERNYY